MTYIVNGKEVEYLHIKEDYNGDIIVEYNEHFNIVNAHMGEIMKRLRKNDLNCIVTKNFKYKIIMILLKKIEDVHSVLSVLNIPYGCYDINEEDKIITIDVPVINELL